MDFTENTIRTGQSVVGDYRLEYSIAYSKDKLTKIDVQVKQVSASAPSYIGNILYVESTKKYSCSLSGTSAEVRATLLADFEKTITEVSK